MSLMPALSDSIFCRAEEIATSRALTRSLYVFSA
jgi:hypothetical protein